MVVKTENIKSIHKIHFPFFLAKKKEGFSDMSHTRWYQTGKETFMQAMEMDGEN